MRHIATVASALSSAAALLAFFLAGCASSRPDHPSITVAAAANLVNAFETLARDFTRDSGTQVVLSFGSTAQLAQQIENGAPFDVFAAADTEHLDRLIAKGLIQPQSRRVYARGRLVLYTPPDSSIRELSDLISSGVTFVSIAKPDYAPYGRAAVEALQSSGLWERLEPKVVYSQSVLMAKQLVDSGNASAGFVALSLVQRSEPTAGQARWVEVDPALFSPIEQALGVVSESRNLAEAKRFAAFVAGPAGQETLQQFGYQAGDPGR
jgi:molybdate transport system substrate-binding protein